MAVAAEVIDPGLLVVLLALGVVLGLVLGAVLSSRTLRMRLRALMRGPFRVSDFEYLSTPLPAEGTLRRGGRDIEDLLDALAAGDCVLFAGAGVAASAGRPTWPELLTHMIMSLSRSAEERSGSWLATLAQQVAAGETQLVAELLRSRYDSAQLAAAAAEAVTLFGTRRPSRLLPTLSALPFAGVVTDDWTDLLTDEFRDRKPAVMTPSRSANAADALRDRQFFVLHAYGLVGNDILLSFDDYRQAIGVNRDFELFVGALFATRTMLFVGTSLEGIEQFCIGSNIRRTPRGRHYALVPEQPNLELQRERLRERFGVELIPYPSDEDRHDAAVEFVRDLAASKRVRAARGRRSISAPDRLEQISLLNIGPFDQLDLVLTEPWTILLGDNSVGKTTILRAVALALSGDSPATSVAPFRLLRSGAAHGRIELKFGRATYATTLRRERDLVRAEAEQVTPVQSGAWLVVGLPVMRGASMGNPTGGGASGSRDPSTSDLLPLLRDDVDVRIDDLKGWIAHQWFAAHEGGDRRAVNNHRRILDTFFSLVEQLTPPLRLSFKGIEAQTGRVLLNSDDGLISFDELSQGLSAMLGGIGVLLQRLYEVYPDDEAPEKRDALLLVDEIDVHLHPEWQSKLLPLLRETFPGLQLMATTHSPLVVANARPGELQHLRREDGRIVAERLDEEFTGWRADQILTGPAFELDTTVGKETAADLTEYRQLQSTRFLTPDQRATMERLRTRLADVVPSAAESPSQREASRLLEEWLDSRLGDAPAAEKRRLIEEAQADLARLKEGPKQE